MLQPFTKKTIVWLRQSRRFPEIVSDLETSKIQKKDNHEIYPMTDPWDERYIYLHENHENQPFM